MAPAGIVGMPMLLSLTPLAKPRNGSQATVPTSRDARSERRLWRLRHNPTFSI
jgi:hypothetical protein